MLPFTIDARIEHAHTLPAQCYRDPAFYEWTREHVFARSWQLVGDEDLVKVPRQVHPFRFLEGCVDEPLVLTRDDDDVVRCLSNVCTHRGNLVAAEPCRAAHLRCVYHGRRFSLDGRFQSMPEFEETAGFPSPADDLPEVQLRRWGPFLFAAIDPACTFEQWIGDMQREMGWFGLDRLVFEPARSRDYLVEANWALYCDNYLEGFHIPFVHASLNTALDYGAYETRLHGYSNVQVGYSSGGNHAFDLPGSSADHGREVAGYYYWLFPNVMFNFYPWGISINVVKPLAVNRTKVSFLTYVSDPGRLDAGAGAGLDRVEREDEAIVEMVQAGISSRLYERGRYSPKRERGVHHFHRLLADHARLYSGPDQHGGTR